MRELGIEERAHHMNLRVGIANHVEIEVDHLHHKEILFATTRSYNILTLSLSQFRPTKVQRSLRVNEILKALDTHSPPGPPLVAIVTCKKARDKVRNKGTLINTPFYVHQVRGQMLLYRVPGVVK